MDVLSDYQEFRISHQRDLLAEADRARLAALLPRRPSPVRHGLALTCHRLANWLDNSNRYLQPSHSGPADWAV